MASGINEIFTEEFKEKHNVASVQYPRYRQIEGEVCLDENDEVVAIGVRHSRKEPDDITILDVGKTYIVEHPYGRAIPFKDEEVVLTGFDVRHPNKRTGIPYVKAEIRTLSSDESGTVEILHLKTIE